MTGTVMLILAGLLWVYEAGAFWGRWWPTLSTVIQSSPNLGPIITGALIGALVTWLWVHLWG